MKVVIKENNEQGSGGQGHIGFGERGLIWKEQTLSAVSFLHGFLQKFRARRESSTCQLPDIGNCLAAIGGADFVNYLRHRAFTPFLSLRIGLESSECH